MRVSSWWLAIALMGCSSASSTKTSIYPGPPWLDAIHWAHVGDGAALGRVEGAVETADFFAYRALYRRVPEAQIPPELKARSGRPLVAVGVNGAAQCQVVPRALVVGYFVNEKAIYDLETEGWAADREWTGQELDDEAVYERLLARGAPQLFFTLETPPGFELTECDEEVVRHHIAVDTAPALERRAAPEALLNKGVALFREHGFWESQQYDYERSREQLRKAAREDYERRLAEAKKEGASAEDIADLYRDTRADKVPATWDTLFPEADSERLVQTPNQGPVGTVWGDGRGTRFLSVELGNEASCAAPRAWMLFRVEGEELHVIDFGVGARPVTFLGRGDGFDVLLYDGYLRSLARLVGDRLEVTRSFSIQGGLQCAHDRLPPLKP